MQQNSGQPPVVFDEYGRPFIILREQQKQARIDYVLVFPDNISMFYFPAGLKGIDAHKANIMAARAVATVMRSSLGPKGICLRLVLIIFPGDSLLH